MSATESVSFDNIKIISEEKKCVLNNTAMLKDFCCNFYQNLFSNEKKNTVRKNKDRIFRCRKCENISDTLKGLSHEILVLSYYFIGAQVKNSNANSGKISAEKFRSNERLSTAIKGVKTDVAFFLLPLFLFSWCFFLFMSLVVVFFYSCILFIYIYISVLFIFILFSTSTATLPF